MDIMKHSWKKHNTVYDLCVHCGISRYYPDKDFKKVKYFKNGMVYEQFAPPCRTDTKQTLLFEE